MKLEILSPLSFTILHTLAKYNSNLIELSFALRNKGFEYNEGSLYQKLLRLEIKGYLKNIDGVYHIAYQGKVAIERTKEFYSC
jgi:DNA-binding PadR family transcriptional regulator